jgi:hypothetical protein
MHCLQQCHQSAAPFINTSKPTHWYVVHTTELRGIDHTTELQHAVL